MALFERREEPIRQVKQIRDLRFTVGGEAPIESRINAQQFFS